MNVRDIALMALVAGTLFCEMADAQETGGYWVKHAGRMSDVMMRKDYSSHLDLSTIKSLHHLYALGPVEGLNGEITIIDSEPSIATVKGGKVTTNKGYPKAAFLVYGQAGKWQAVSVPSTVNTAEELESFVGKSARSKGVNVGKPFPFLIKGAPKEITYHVVKAGEHLRFIERGKPVQVLGFYSTHDQGIFVHHGTNIHLHFVTEDRETSGHIDALVLSGASLLYLPVPEHGQQNHAEGVNKRGDMAMGFDHSKTIHHFRLFKSVM